MDDCPIKTTISGWWWLEPWNFEWLSHHIGNFIIPTGPNSIIFQRVGLNHQADLVQGFKQLARFFRDDFHKTGISKPQGGAP